MNNTVEQTKRPFTKEEIMFFESGFFVYEIEDPILRERVSQLGKKMTDGIDSWVFDNVDTDVKMPHWSAFYDFNDPLCLEFINLYQPIIERHSFIYDSMSKVTELSMQSGIHHPALSWHSDYVDTHRADAFMLTYPGTGPLNGGELLMGKRTIWNTVDETFRMAPDPYKIIFINNMNPFFVHKVEPLKAEDNFKRLVCSIGWRRNSDVVPIPAYAK